MQRLLGALVAASLVVPLLTAPAATGNATGLGVAVAVLLLAGLTLVGEFRHTAPSAVCTATGPTADERCLRGSFRLHNRPDAPGRQRPRAPGDGPLPA